MIQVRKVLLAVLFCTVGISLSFGQSINIDSLCPPRPETAAVFKPGAYPAAVRPYREAALATYRYMMSLPAMTDLVKTGKPSSATNTMPTFPRPMRRTSWPCWYLQKQTLRRKSKP